MTRRLRHCILAVMMMTAHAAAQSIAVVPHTQTLDVHHVSSVQLRIDSVGALRAYSITVRFDPLVLRCVSVRELNFLSSNYQTFFFSYIDTVHGTVRIDAAILGEGSVGGSGLLADIQLRGIHTGSSRIEIINSDIRGAANAPVQLLLSHGAITVDVLSSVRRDESVIPHAFAIGNYPNPFNPETEVVFTIPREEYGSVSICTLRGQVVDVLEQGRLAQGTHRIRWNAAGRPSGVYFAVVRTEYRAELTKLMLLK